jgi:hypothetical protein
MSEEQKETEDAELQEQINRRVTEIFPGSLITEALNAEDVAGFQTIEEMETKIAELKECVKRNLSAKNIVTLSAKDLIIDHMLFISEAKEKVIKGTFFRSLDDLWNDASVPFDGADVTLFSRSHDAHAKGAVGDENSLKADSSRSHTPPTPRENIFGKPIEERIPPSAHLMPHSRDCASCWYHFVPWVLSHRRATDSEQRMAHDKAWLYMQKCIHGFSKRRQATTQSDKSTGSNRKRKETSSKNQGCIQATGSVETNTRTRSSNNSKGAGSANEQRNYKVQRVGIKHFPSNRILLRSQLENFDRDHCVLILPIMSVDKVKDWKWMGYDAIVLVSEYKYTNGEKKKALNACEVYREIEASYGVLRFATKNECEIARELLETMILCVCKSFKETFLHYFSGGSGNGVTLENKEALRVVFEKLQNQGDSFNVPVPKSGDWSENNMIDVRKIRFTDREINTNPAPDPVLLLAKSTSNWFKLHEFDILPACDNDQLSDGSDSTASENAEAVAREWSTDTWKRHHSEEILVSSTLDESLSDIDDDES